MELAPGRRTRPSRRTSRLTAAAATITTLVLTATGLVAVAPAQAVSTQHGDRMVSEVPAAFTPHVVDGSVNSFVQVGTTMYAAGTFTAVRQTPTGPDIPRRGLVAFDVATGTIDPGFNPVLGGRANSLDTDGTFLYVGGAFGSVGGATKVRRIVKLTAAGAVVPQFKAVPSAAVNEVVVRGNRLFVAGQFTSISGTAANAFAVLDATTGAVLNGPEVPFGGTYNLGSTSIVRMDVDATGSAVVAIGNFVTVAGQPREQIALLDVPPAGPVTVSGWSTARMTKARNVSCSKNFQSWMRDVDIAADGSYFVVTTTGAFGGGANNGAMCDTASRWELGRTGAGQEPTWVTYTGGDTSYGVAITGGAVYTGGHFRWQNNAFQGDQAGPGAVPREGIAALDPVNGMPLSWNPGRTRGVGAQALYATSQGLWVGSDTERFNNRLRMRIAYLPLAGGTQLPASSSPTLPGDLYAATPAGAAATGVVWRINAGGQPALQSGDAGPGWVNESGRVSGGSNVNYTAVATTEPAVPAGTPATVFSSERTGARQYSLPVSTGRPLTVRLYFANQAAATALPGQRTFDVTLDGTVVLDDFDVVAATGRNRTGTVRAFDITSDGIVNVGLTAVLGNPLINGIEIIDRSLVGAAATPGALVRRPMTTSGAPAGPATVVDTGMDWSRVRGLASTGGTVYYGLPDGGLHARSFDPATGAVGAQRTINLYDDPEDGRRIPVLIPNLTGLTFDPSTHRLYYTLFNDARLYFRYFSPESEIVGAQTFVADPGTTTSFAAAAGLALADGRLLYGSTTDGNLRSVALTAAGLSGPATVVSADGSWRYRSMFVASAAA